MSLLEVQDLSMRFGGVAALHQVGFVVEEGTITALIGPNGAGKTTVFNCVTGFYRPHQGSIRLHRPEGALELTELLGGPFRGRDFASPGAFFRRLKYKIAGGSHLAARAGVARTFQNIRLFRGMTVMENLLAAQYNRLNRHLLSGVLGTPGFARAEREGIRRASAWLEFFALLEDANRLAGELPYGKQRRLEMARAMCISPRLLCLDEPAAGLNPQETAELAGWIRRLRQDHGVTLLLIEHDMGLVMEISDHVVVLDHGEVIAAGTPAQVRRDPKVLTAYLGLDEPSP
ncbi:MAG: ATP-binding cassette domain-containing protein [Magnetococcales bacterium]|nr:ATP-binding cassette domain-containing protein [Magnetococcales bacterium]